MNYRLVLPIILFLAGFIFIMNYRTSDVREGFEIAPGNCPNLLIKKDNAYYLQNTNKAEVPGVNPVRFENLEDYKEFMQWLRSEGIRCPVLYLQQTYDTQGERTYRVLPDAEDQHAGLPPTQPMKETKLFDAGHDKGSFPGFDPDNQYIGDFTPLDDMFHSKEAISDSPIDTHWGGPEWTREQIRDGKYKDRYVYGRNKNTAPMHIEN